MHEAIENAGKGDFSAAVILATPPYFNGQQQELIRVVDALCARHIGTVMVTHSDADQAAAKQIASADGLMAVPQNCSPEELAGRIAGLVAAKPLVDQLQRENMILRKFDQGVNHQMTQLDEEMRLAARLQVDFLPRTLPVVNGCSFHVLFRPATYVSGDIYDVARLDEHHVGFYVADAVGHGMPAALLTIYIKRALKAKVVTEEGYRIVPPGEALGALNEDMLAQHLSLCQFVTMAYGILNTQTLELQYARAGHPLPLHLKRDGVVTELEADGALLGVFPNEVFVLQKVQLEPGDGLLIYSDGFETAFSDAGGEVNPRYREEFAKLAGDQPEGRLQNLAKALDEQEGSLHPRDDLTAVLLAVSAERGR
jgi:serine phosphatase RsbU (regulator of sigma subunit)